MNTADIACNLNLLDAGQRRRRERLVGALRGRAQRIEETAEGYRLLFPSRGGSWLTAAELLELERRCCPFLRFELSVGRNGKVTMQLGGGVGVKGFLAGELGLPARRVTPPAPRRTAAFLLGPIAAAAASLVCCVGPLLLAAAGIASAGLGVAAAGYRVPIAAAAVGFIAAGCLVLYRPFSRRSRGRPRATLPRAIRVLFWSSSAVALAGAVAALLF